MYLVKSEGPWARSLLSWGAVSGAQAAGGGGGVVGVLEASPPAGRLWTGETRYHSHKQLCVVPGPPAIPQAEMRCQPHLQMGERRLWRFSILSQVRQWKVAGLHRSSPVARLLTRLSLQASGPVLLCPACTWRLPEREAGNRDGLHPLSCPASQLTPCLLVHSLST